jgi:hypothetical protein
LLFPPDNDDVDMRKPAATTTVATSKVSLAADGRDGTPAGWVCLALALALFALAFRIACVW